LRVGRGLHQAVRDRTRGLRDAAANRQGERSALCRDRAGGGALSSTRLFRAPGRVSLTGEHTDYSGGLVLPAAIPRGISLIGEPAAELALESDGFAADEGWLRYVTAVAEELGVTTGFRGRVVSDLPAGAGRACLGGGEG